MAVAQFQPGAPAGFIAESGMRGFEQGQSMMLRAQQAKQAEQLAKMRAQQHAEEIALAPLKRQQQMAETANSMMQLKAAMNMQETETELAPLVGEAQAEFNQMMKMTDPGLKANAALAFSGKYAQFRNTKKWGPQFTQFDDIAKQLYTENSAIRRAQEMERLKDMGPESPIGKMTSDYSKALKAGQTQAAEWILSGIKEEITPKGMSLETGPDGSIRFFQGSAGLTTPNTTESQKKQFAQERLIREGGQLLNILRPEDLGIQGNIGEIAGGFLGQLDPKLANEQVAENRTRLRSFREGALRAVSDDPRFSNEDRKAITQMLPEEGIVENLPQAKGKLKAVITIMAQRAKMEAGRRGDKSWTELPPEEIITGAREGKIDKDAAAAILDVLHPQWVKEQANAKSKPN
jgi:hypothetical protein